MGKPKNSKLRMRALQMVADGRTQKDVEERLGLSQGLLTRWKQQEGLPKGRTSKRYPAALKKTVVDQAAREGLAAAVRATGVSKSSVQNWMARGDGSPGPGRPPGSGREEARMIVEMRDEAARARKEIERLRKVVKVLLDILVEDEPLA